MDTITIGLFEGLWYSLMQLTLWWCTHNKPAGNSLKRHSVETDISPHKSYIFIYIKCFWPIQRWIVSALFLVALSVEVINIFICMDNRNYLVIYPLSLLLSIQGVLITVIILLFKANSSRNFKIQEIVLLTIIGLCRFRHQNQLYFWRYNYVF